MSLAQNMAAAEANAQLPGLGTGRGRLVGGPQGPWGRAELEGTHGDCGDVRDRGC